MSEKVIAENNSTCGIRFGEGPMKSLVGVATWFWLTLLIVPAAQAQEPKDEPEVKLPALLSAKPIKENAKDDELTKLLKERYNTAVSEVKELYEMYQRGRGTIDTFTEAAQRLVKAGLEVHEKPADRVTLLTQFVELSKEVEKQAKERFEAGRILSADYYRTRYQRIDAEIQLLRARAKIEKKKGK